MLRDCPHIFQALLRFNDARIGLGFAEIRDHKEEVRLEESIGRRLARQGKRYAMGPRRKRVLKSMNA